MRPIAILKDIDLNKSAMTHGMPLKNQGYPENLRLAKTDTDYIQKHRRKADLLWWNERDQGQFKETVRPVEIEAGGGLRINAGLTHVTI